MSRLSPWTICMMVLAVLTAGLLALGVVGTGPFWFFVGAAMLASFADTVF